jgi:hypothetical protein
MPRCEERRNRFSGKIYVASIVPTRGRIQIPMHLGEMPIEPLQFNHLSFQAAVYPKERIYSWRLAFTLPTLVINLDCLPESVSEDEFAEVVGKLLADEQVNDLYSENTYYAVYKRYGFESMRHDVRPVFRLKKVKHIFIFQTPESLAPKRPV